MILPFSFNNIIIVLPSVIALFSSHIVVPIFEVYFICILCIVKEFFFPSYQ